jgi:hypothetical protein
LHVTFACGYGGMMNIAKQRRAHVPRAIAETVDRLTRPLFAKRGFAQGAVMREWDAIVGPELSAQTLPERIAFPPGMRNGGTLHLRVGNGVAATTLQHLEPMVIERINGYFGYAAVIRLRLIQRPLPPRPAAPLPRVRALDGAQEARLQSCLASVPDGDLRQALDALGRAIMGRNERHNGP